jgi:serine/threonine protein kinase
MQPQRIHQYEIIERLGEGPHGESFRAHDPVNHRTVVLKLVNAEVFHQDSEIDLFKDAMLRLVNVSHPNLASLYAVDETEEAVLIAHEYVEGIGIGEFLERGPLPYKQFLDLAIQITEGIQALHSRGLIHGHISTDNVMIDQNDNVKLVDYGLPALGPAYLEEEPSDSQRVSVWTAEESEQPPEADADFFALGGLFYEMLTGRAPYSDQGGESTAGLAALPPEARLLVEKLLSTEKQDQFMGASELLATLREMKEFAESPPAEDAEKHASPRTYLIISIIAFLLIIIWWVATILHK